jgi:hypothetical protein
MIIFDGILEVVDVPGANNLEVTYYGTVTLAEHSDARKVPAPVRNAFKAFCDSDKEFRLTGTATPLDGANDGNRFKNYRIHFNGGEGWEFGGKKHLDMNFELVTALQWKGSPDKREALCYGTGNDEYGSFIGTGWMRPGNRITIARRYVSDDRRMWSATKVEQEVLKKIWDEDEEECEMPPWKCTVLSA